MPGLGPRVGGAHVDVNMKFDDRSLSDVGKRIHKQLTEISQKNSKIYRSIGRDAVVAWRAALGTIVSSAPLIGSAMSAAAGGVTILAGSLYSLGQTSAAALPIFTSLGIAGLTASIGMRNFGAAVSEVDPKKLKQLLADMPKSMQAAVMSTRAMSREMRAVIWEKMFVGIGPLMERLRETGVIQRGLGQMAESLNFMARGVLKYATSAQGVSVLNKFFENNVKVFKELSRAVVPFLDGFLRLVNALTPAAIRLAKRITGVGETFQSWTKGEGFAKRIDDQMKKAEKTAGLLIDVFVNVYKAITNIFNIANPSSNNLLTMLVNVTERFQKFTESVGGQDSIAKWASQSVDVLAQFGRTAEAVFKVIAELADPRVITSFLKTVEGAFNILGQLPLDKMVDAFVRVAEALQPVSSLFLAIIIGGAALNIMIGSIIGQFAGLFGILAGIVKFKILTNILKNSAGGAGKAGGAAAGAAKKVGLLSRAWQFLVNVFNKIKSVFSRVTGLFSSTSKATGQVASKAGKLSGAFKPALKILGRFAKFAGPVGLAVYVGSLVSDSDKLKGKLKGVWDAVKGVGSSLKDAFAGIAESLQPLAPVMETVGKAIGPVFGFMDKIASLAIGLVLDTIRYAFESLANVIEGVGKIVAGFIDVIIGIATFDGDKILGGLKKMVSGVVPLLKGMFGLFVTFFAPARLLKLGATAFKALGGGIKTALPGILRAVGNMVVKVLDFVGRLPGRLLSLGGRAIKALAGAVVRNAPKVLAGAGRIVLGVLKWIGRLPGRLLSLGAQAISRLAGAVVSNAPKVISGAGRIFTGVVNWIKQLPGRLLAFGKSAITKLAGAVQAGVSRLKTIAGNIVDSVTGAIGALPGKMLDIGKNIIQSLYDGITSGIGKIKDAMSKVADVAGKFWPGSPVKMGPLKKWNHGSDASGGGRNVIEALTAGLRDTDPIRKAMNDVASVVATSLTPRVSGGVETRRSGGDTGLAPAAAAGGNVYIGTMMPHNYGEFEKQTMAKKRLVALGGNPILRGRPA